ncbi:translation initiation factor IF-2-like [Eucalyptus grandis]|uniref:translation initiation factor IF-2-like n=1 Tax=Eucalyptus grandis TaxID=71139 RepID=UPI00192ECD77|nr:translation initiation factor IF-2-like [Eucalyptus grandis]
MPVAVDSEPMFFRDCRLDVDVAVLNGGEMMLGYARRPPNVEVSPLQGFDIPAVAVNAALGEGAVDPPDGAVEDPTPPEPVEVESEGSRHDRALALADAAPPQHPRSARDTARRSPSSAAPPHRHLTGSLAATPLLARAYDVRGFAAAPRPCPIAATLLARRPADPAARHFVQPLAGPYRPMPDLAPQPDAAAQARSQPSTRAAPPSPDDRRRPPSVYPLFGI